MKTALDDEGTKLGEFKISRLMRESGIIEWVSKKPHYYPSGKQLPNIPNQLSRQFNSG
jgi:hypothetical protein